MKGKSESNFVPVQSKLQTQDCTLRHVAHVAQLTSTGSFDKTVNDLAEAYD